MSVEVQLVTEPRSGATVLADLNEERLSGSWVSMGLDLGSPEWELSPSGLVEGTREITIPIMVDGGDLSAQEAKLSAIARTLTRRHRSVWLRWRTTPSTRPVWFRLHRQLSGVVSWDRVYVDRPGSSTYQWGVRVTADAWAVGEQVNIPSFSVATGQVQQGVPLPEIVGDIPAPLDVDFEPNGSLAGWEQMLNVSAVQPDSTFPGSIYMFGSSFTPESGSTVQGFGMRFTSASASGSGKRVMQGNVDIVSGQPMRSAGRYKVLALCRYESWSGTPMGWWAASVIDGGSERRGAFTPWRPWNALDQSWVDLGEIDYPAARVTTRDGDRLGPLNLGLIFRHDPVASGGGQGVVDALLLVPIDQALGADRARTLKIKWGQHAPAAGGYGGRLLADDRKVLITYGGFVRSYPGARAHGGWPVVHPGSVNYLSWLHRVNHDSAQSASSTPHWEMSTTLTCSYRPRWLHVAGI